MSPRTIPVRQVTVFEMVGARSEMGARADVTTLSLPVTEKFKATGRTQDGRHVREDD